MAGMSPNTYQPWVLLISDKYFTSSRNTRAKLMPTAFWNSKRAQAWKWKDILLTRFTSILAIVFGEREENSDFIQCMRHWSYSTTVGSAAYKNVFAQYRRLRLAELLMSSSPMHHLQRTMSDQELCPECVPTHPAAKRSCVAWLDRRDGVTHVWLISHRLSHYTHRKRNSIVFVPVTRVIGVGRAK